MSSHYILIINALLFSGLFLFCFYRKGCGTLAKLSTLTYAVLACCAAFFAYQGAFYGYLTGLRLWPFLVYFILAAIMLFPFIKSDKLTEKLVINNTKRANLIGDIYLICCVIQIILTGSKAITAVVTGNYLSLYLARGEAGANFYYNNFFEQVVVNVVNYFFIPIVLYAFYVMVHDVAYKRKKLLMVVPFLTSSLSAVASASRTDFFYIILVYGTIFFLYRKPMSRKFQRAIAVVGLLFVVVAMLATRAITASRFAYDEEGEWLSNYFGESYIIAHDTFVHTTRYSEGTYFFRDVIPFIGVKYIPTHCTIDHGFGFRPMISTRYSDFGSIGCGVYAILCMLLFTYLVSKKKYSWGMFYIILFYYKSLTLGAFYENNTAMAWIYVLIVSFILTKFTSTKYDKNNRILSPTVSSNAS